MDPNEALRQLRLLATAVIDNESDDTDPTLIELAEGVLALDGWMSSGGFSPWARPAVQRAAAVTGTPSQAERDAWHATIARWA